MPISKENRVRVEFFSKMTATPRGPSSGRRLNGVSLQLGGQRQHLGLLVGRQVVVAQEVADHDASAVSSTAGSAARKSSICSSVRTSGGASRITSGAAAFTRKPASRAAVSTAWRPRR